MDSVRSPVAGLEVEYLVVSMPISTQTLAWIVFAAVLMRDLETWIGWTVMSKDGLAE